MKRCNGDHPYEDGGSGPLNWLNWQAPDDRCPKCGLPTETFIPAPLGQLLEDPE